ncbi:MAG: hypothetical protein PHU51_04970 [Candidatus Nanoarchaeia archaeon]|nr:hypothetical protein [Candidatus Nanoarchaeia archaeon]
MYLENRIVVLTGYKSFTLSNAFNNRFNHMRLKNIGTSEFNKYSFNFIAG